MTKLDTLLANAEDASSMMLYKTGQISAMVILHSKDGIFAFPYKTNGPETVWLEQCVILATVRSCYRANAFEGLVMLSEAWMAKAIEGDDRRPSEREDKEEKVVLGIWDSSLKKTMAMYPIIRNEKKVLLGSRDPEPLGSEFKSWLDKAFV